MHDTNRPEYKHHVETHGDPTRFGYADFVPMFKAEKFDADEWADLFVKTNFPSLLEDPERAILYGYMPRTGQVQNGVSCALLQQGK